MQRVRYLSQTTMKFYYFTLLVRGVQGRSIHNAGIGLFENLKYKIFQGNMPPEAFPIILGAPLLLRNSLKRFGLEHSLAVFGIDNVWST